MLPTATTTERTGTMTQSKARYLEMTTMRGRSPGMCEQVNGSFCQL